MEKKSTLSVEGMLMLALVVILVVGLIAVVQLYLPSWSKLHCLTAQRQHIEEVNSILADVKSNGITQIYKFKVEQMCVDCIYMNNSASEPTPSLRVKYNTQIEPEKIPIDLPWNNINIKGDNQPADCSDVDIVVGGKMCTLEITTNNVDNKGCA